MTINRKMDSNFYGTREFFVNDKTGHEYNRLVGGLAWPVADAAGVAVVIAEERVRKPKGQPKYFVVTSHEDFNVSNLLRACIALGRKNHVSTWYGDSGNEPMMRFLDRLKVPLTIYPPPHLGDPDELAGYVAVIRELAAPSNKKLFFQGSSIGSRLLAIPADRIRTATRAADWPLLMGVGAALSSVVTWVHDPQQEWEVQRLNESLAENYNM